MSAAEFVLARVFLVLIAIALSSVVVDAKNITLSYNPIENPWIHMMYDQDNFICDNFAGLCNNFLDQIACTDRTVVGCAPDLPNYVGTCRCNGKPVYQDKGSRISKELLDNRIKPEIGWMMEPWSTGPPYDFDVSFNGICQLTLYRLGCPTANRTIIIGSTDGHHPYTCACGHYVDSSTRVQELMVDKMNEAQLMEMPIFDDPFTLSIELSMAVVMILGKIGSMLASLVYLPSIIGYLLVGMGMQDIINPGLIKGAGGNGPHATPFGEMRIFALIIVLMRAGISLKPQMIYKEGIFVLLLSFLPYFAEFAIEWVLILHFQPTWSLPSAGLLASILAALSPSLVIPGMLSMVDQHLGQTPRKVLMSAPIEVVLAIILYNIFSGLLENTTNPMYPWIATFPLYANILLIPVNILCSMVIGFIGGFALSKYFAFRRQMKQDNLYPNILARVMPLNTAEFLFASIVTSYTLYALCQPMYFQETSGILAVFVQMLTIAELSDDDVVKELKEALASLWVFVEVILFTSTGINLSFKDSTGPLQSDRGISPSDIGSLVAVLFLGSLGRSVGVMASILLSLPRLQTLSIFGTTTKDKIQYLGSWWLATWMFQIPKATVQATLGGLPFAQHVIPGAKGLTMGIYILHASAFAVLLMAPIGVFLTAVVGKPLAVWLHEVDTRLNKVNGNNNNNNLVKVMTIEGDSEPDDVIQAKVMEKHNIHTNEEEFAEIAIIDNAFANDEGEAMVDNNSNDNNNKTYKPVKSMELEMVIEAVADP